MQSHVSHLIIRCPVWHIASHKPSILVFLNDFDNFGFSSDNRMQFWFLTTQYYRNVVIIDSTCMNRHAVDYKEPEIIPKNDVLYLWPMRVKALFGRNSTFRDYISMLLLLLKQYHSLVFVRYFDLKTIWRSILITTGFYQPEARYSSSILVLKYFRKWPLS